VIRPLDTVSSFSFLFSFLLAPPLIIELVSLIADANLLGQILDPRRLKKKKRKEKKEKKKGWLAISVS
jgi:hypothetical protein